MFTRFFCLFFSLSKKKTKETFSLFLFFNAILSTNCYRIYLFWCTYRLRLCECSDIFCVTIILVDLHFICCGPLLRRAKCIKDYQQNTPSLLSQKERKRTNSCNKCLFLYNRFPSFSSNRVFSIFANNNNENDDDNDNIYHARTLQTQIKMMAIKLRAFFSG